MHFLVLIYCCFLYFLRGIKSNVSYNWDMGVQRGEGKSSILFLFFTCFGSVFLDILNIFGCGVFGLFVFGVL